MDYAADTCASSYASNVRNLASVTTATAQENVHIGFDGLRGNFYQCVDCYPEQQQIFAVDITPKISLQQKKKNGTPQCSPVVEHLHSPSKTVHFLSENAQISMWKMCPLITIASKGFLRFDRYKSCQSILCHSTTWRKQASLLLDVSHRGTSQHNTMVSFVLLRFQHAQREVSSKRSKTFASFILQNSCEFLLHSICIFCVEMVTFWVWKCTHCQCENVHVFSVKMFIFLRQQILIFSMKLWFPVATTLKSIKFSDIYRNSLQTLFHCLIAFRNQKLC